MNHFVFANLGYLWLLLLLPFIIAYYVWRQKETSASLTFSSLQGFAKTYRSWRYYLRHILFALRVSVFVLMIIVIARPQSTNSSRNITSEGIDIVLTLDISSSMLARDFSPDRLEASKNVASEFISGRPNDRIGLVVFSSESFTQCPLTTDHAVLLNLFRGIKSGMIDDGTAIGQGLATAVNRLKDSKSVSRVIILLTDGVNNAGSISPAMATDIAKTYGIRVYTVGVGTMGEAPYPVQTPFGIQFHNMKVEIDEALLRDIAKMTGGKYFRATNNRKLHEIYQEIDRMEKSKIEMHELHKYDEKFFIYGLMAFLLLLGELILRNTVLRTIP
jgi:Ca-activated chloride channel homolog